MAIVNSNNENETNQIFFLGRYSNLTSLLIDHNILKYFNDFYNWLLHFKRFILKWIIGTIYQRKIHKQELRSLHYLGYHEYILILLFYKNSNNKNNLIMVLIKMRLLIFLILSQNGLACKYKTTFQLSTYSWMQNSIFWYLV